MKENVSALLDGNLEDHALRPVLENLRSDPALRREWETWCLIGDTLRHDGDGGTSLVADVMARLDAEPTVLAPQAMPRRRDNPWQSLLPIAAGVMGVAAVGLVAATLYADKPQAPLQLAGERALVQSVAVARARTEGQISSDELQREYMLAHQGVSGSGPLPAGLHYARTVSELREGAAR